jgi:hypothetical protein
MQSVVSGFSPVSSKTIVMAELRNDPLSAGPRYDKAHFNKVYASPKAAGDKMVLGRIQLPVR